MRRGFGRGGYGGRGYGGRGYGGRGSGGAKKSTYGSYGACFKCGQPGHWAPQCPYNRAPAQPANRSSGAASSSYAPAPSSYTPTSSSSAPAPSAAPASTAPSTAIVPKPWVRLPATPVSQDYLDEHEVCYGTLNVPIVGCQYYQGVLHQGEMASLVREPNNQYDKNAIRVDNLSAAQVGHVKRTYAAALAPIMDDPSPAAPRVEVTIPREPTNMYEVLGELKMIGLKEHAEAAVAALRAGGHFTLKDGYAAKAAAAQQAAAQLAAQQAAAAQQAWQQQLAWQQPVAQPVQVVKMDAASCERELDALFEKELALQGAISTDAAAAALSASVVRSALLPHQLQALAWMMAQEDEATPPPASVYERRLEKGQEVWFCTVTNSSTAVKPHGARGGLLCDDMGLGKTLTTLALIAVNQPDGVRLSGAAPAAPAAPAKEEEMAEAAAAEDEAAAEEEAEEEEQEEFDEEEEVRQAKRLRVGELREALAAHGQEESGTKPVLVERLVNTKRSAAAAARAAKQLSAAAAAKQAASAAAAKAASAEEAEGRSVAAEAAAAAHAAGCGGTLVVCPTSVLSNWATQMGEHVPGALRVATHHGAGKESAEGLAAAHVVLTTYGTLGAEWKAWTAAKEGGGGKKRKQGAHGSLFDLHWHRIVLDEARAARAHAPAVRPSWRRRDARWRPRIPACSPTEPPQGRARQLEGGKRDAAAAAHESRWPLGRQSDPDLQQTAD